MKTNRSARSASSSLLRWCARVLGLLLSGLCLLFFMGESLESRRRAALHGTDGGIGPAGIVGPVLFGIYVLAMFLALRWERICVWLGASALGCFYVMMFLGLFAGDVEGGVSNKGLSNEGVLNPILLVFWVPIVLYFVCWRVERAAQTAPAPPA